LFWFQKDYAMWFTICDLLHCLSRSKW
jgi:hypothetical protein